jgi:glycosyltransferase involved in cell wall biosynthesis
MKPPVVAMVCHFPPPVHGAGLISARVREHLARQGNTIVSIDTAPDSLSRSLRYYLARIRRLFRLGLLLRLGPDDLIYCSVNSNWGVLIDLIVALIARIVGAKLWLHHHSFFYLGRSSLLHSATFSVARERTHHIVLCEIMREKLVETYGLRNDKVHILSNINFVKPADRLASRPERPLSIGFLSNITEEKGIAEFLNLSSRLQDLPVYFEIAGPIVDISYEWIRGLEFTPDRKTRWAGVLDEDAKDKFFARIDMLIFPTLYRNEADPLVIHEAMAAGVVVVAYDRGCIREVIETPHVIAADVDEIEQAVRKLLVQRPSRAEVLEKYERRRDRDSGQMAVLGMV